MIQYYSNSVSIIYVKCHEAAINLQYKIVTEEIVSRVFEFRTKGSFWSFGEDFTVAVTSEDAGKVKVEVNSKSTMPLQIIDWGTNNDNIKRFFKTLDSLLQK